MSICHSFPIKSIVIIAAIWYGQDAPAFSQAQFTSSKNYEEAVNWKTFVLQNINDLKVPAPPGMVQTQKELAEVKEKVAKVDQKMLKQIQYWDAGSPAYRWNEIANKLLSFENPTFFRLPTSWMSMAIYDGTVAAWKAKYDHNKKRPFQVDPAIKPVVSPPATPSYPCEHSVTAAAASNVLAYFFPEVADSILKLAREAAQSRIYAGVQFPADVTAGWHLGEQIANRIIEQAKKDGSDIPWKGKMPDDPKRWRGDYPVGIMVANYKPIVIKSADQFRPPAPPDFSKDMQELKDFKQDFRSAYLAYHWASLTGFDIWTELAGKKIFEEHLDDNTPLCARIYALLHVAMYDAAIAIMDAKYAYWGIRPFQYDTTYQPLIFTPPFPGYPSGHATASSAAATILSYFFPADEAFFKQTAKDCADSRFYAGIHFQTDNKTGLELGAKLASYIIDNWEKKDGTAKAVPVK